MVSDKERAQNSRIKEAEVRIKEAEASLKELELDEALYKQALRNQSLL